MNKTAIRSIETSRHWCRLAVLAATTALTPVIAHAQTLPTDGQVVAGNATVATTGNAMTVTQTSDRAVIDWSGFSIGTGNEVVFVQPDAGSAMLNRVRGDTASTIAGSLTSNGTVYLVNPNGIFITDTGTVSTGGGFVASTLGISNDDFLDGKLNFKGAGASAPVTNAGRIAAAQGAYVALLGGAVSNSGTIRVPLGKLGLGSGEQVALDINGGNFMQVSVPSALVTSSNVRVDNSGEVVVIGGSVQLKAAVLRDAVRNLVNMSGSINADSASGQAGSIELSAGGDGRVAVSGTLSANGTGETGAGGYVSVEGRDITLGGGAAITATGPTGGGTVLVGGGYRGEGPLTQAQTVSMAPGATIDVSATTDGKGGTAVLWSDITDSRSVTDFAGTIRARGTGSGNGGLVETSGYRINFADGHVDAGAGLGTGGDWLIDPAYTTIGQTEADAFRDTLNTGTNVINDATGAITWNSGVTLNKTAGGDATLTLRTTNNEIALNNASIVSTSGKLNLVLWTRYNTPANRGRVAITGSTVTTNGGHVWVGGGNTSGAAWNGLTVGDDSALADTNNQSGMLVKNSTITTDAGDIWLKGRLNYVAGNGGSGNFGLALDSGARLVTTSGSVTLTGSIAGTYSSGIGVQIGGTDAGNVSVSTGSGAITINGGLADQGSDPTGPRHAVALYARSGNSISLSTVSGAIDITGNANSTLGTTNDSSGIQFQSDNTGSRIAVTSRTGAITLTGTAAREANGAYVNGIRLTPSDESNSIRIGYDGANSYSGDITINANSLLQRNASYTNTGPISVQTTGRVAIQPIGTSFTYLRADTGTLTFDGAWNFGTALSGFTLGKAGNTFDLTFAAPAFRAAGPVSLYGGNITLNKGIESTLSGADLLVKATGSITTADSLGFYTNNGKIIFWSNAAGSTTAGGIWTGAGNVFNSANRSTTQLTGGGDIVFGGGGNAGATPTGAASSSSQFGIGIGSGMAGSTGTTTTTFYSGGGAISMNAASTGGANGLSLNRGFSIGAGNGAISLTGSAASGGAGIELVGWGDFSTPFSITGGSVSMTATGGASNGIASLHKGGTIEATGAGGITLNGDTTASGSGAYGVRAINANLNLVSATGPISVTGTAANGTTGVTYLGKIVSASGAITVNSGTRTLSFSGTIGRDGSTVPASSSAVTLTGDSIAFSAASTIATSGAVTLQPSSASFSSALNWPLTNLTLSSDISGLTLGKAGNTANITVGNAVNIAGPISLYGGNIVLNAGLESTLAGARILVKATGSITTADNLGFYTNNGAITFWSNAAGSTTAGGIKTGNANIFNSANHSTSQLTGGGDIVFGGGNNAGAAPTGAASSSTQAGVAFGNFVNNSTTTAIYSGGGRITVNGASTMASGNNFGLALNQTAVLNAGNGAITLIGNSSNGHGIEIGAYNQSGPISSFTAGGDITVIGFTTSTGSHSGVEAGQPYGVRIRTTGTGNISITGSASSSGTGRAMSFNTASNALISDTGSITVTGSGSRGVHFNGGKIVSNSGAIAVNSGTGTLNLSATVGRDGTDVTSSSSNVTLTADSSTITSTAINTSGTVTVQPFSTSFSSALTWPISGLTLSSNVTGLTLGKVGNTANITIASATAIDGPITIYGGNILVNAALSAAENAIALHASGTGAISGSGVISSFSNLTLDATNAAGSGTLTGAIASTGNVIKSGAGTIILNGRNTYTGATNVNAGNLRSGSTSAFGHDSAVTVAAGATLTVRGYDVTIGSLSGAGTVTNGSTTNSTLTVGSLDTDSTFSGTIQNGSTGVLALAKSGSGVFTLSGANTYTGHTTVDGGTLSLTGSLNVGSGIAAATVASGATLSGTGVVTAATFSSTGAGTVTLTGNNHVGAIATTGTIGAFRFNNAQSRSLGSINSTGPITITASGATSDLTLASGTTIASSASGDAITLSSGRNFVNNASASAVSASNGRWLIYSATPGGATFNGLNSGHTAIWNSTYSGGTVSQTGNRYLFATQPTLTVTSTSQSKVYGDAPPNTVATAYTVSGYHAGIAGAFLGDDVNSALSGSISFASAGAAVTANVGNYATSVASNTLSSNAGYAITVNAAGTITVTPRTVTLSAQKVYDGTTSLAGAVTLGNLANGETLTYTGATAASSHVADNSTNHIIGVTLADGTGLASNYALPTLNATNATASITPAALTATAAIGGPLTKVYDGTTATGASVTGSVSGAIAGDTIGFDASGITLGYNSAHVATANSIAATGTGGFSITGSTNASQASDYSFTDASITNATASITPAALTATASIGGPLTKVYDGTTATGASVTGSVSGAIAGDTIGFDASGITLGYNSAHVATANSIAATGTGGFSITGSTNASQASDYSFTDASITNATASITPAALTATAAIGGPLTKVYDGTTATGASVTGSVSGAIAGDTIGFDASGITLGYNSAHVATANSIAATGTGGFSITGSTSGSQASDYSFTDASIANAAASITPRQIAVTAVDATRSYGSADPAFTYTVGGSGLVSGDALTGSQVSDAVALSNVGTYTIGRGSLAASADYAMTYVGGVLTVTRLDVSTWIGGPNGNWFDPANWAGGAVPTLSNVANVVLPAGSTVNFDMSGASAPIPNGPVNLDSLGRNGGLTMTSGVLNVGSGGVNLAVLNQSGGTLTSGGGIGVGSFTQTGGATSTASGFTASNGFSQTGAGTLSVGGNAAIGATNGTVNIGNLGVGGGLTVDNTGGAIRQGAGTQINVGGAGSYHASEGGRPADITLANPGNDLGQVVSANGANVALTQNGDLKLGDLTASGNLNLIANGQIDFGRTGVGGDLNAKSSHGGITQSSPIEVAGTTSLDAGDDDILLRDPRNSLGGSVSMNGGSISLGASNDLTLGNINASGALNVASGTGKITQEPGTVRKALGGETIGGPSSGNQSITPFVVPKNLTPGYLQRVFDSVPTKAAQCGPGTGSEHYRADGRFSPGEAGCGF